MSERDVLLAEVGAALSIFGLLLVFLPLFLQRVQEWAADGSTQANRRWRIRLLWFPPILMAVAALDASMGLLTLWDKVDAPNQTGWLLLVLVWATVLLAILSVIARK